MVTLLTMQDVSCYLRNFSPLISATVRTSYSAEQQYILRYIPGNTYAWPLFGITNNTEIIGAIHIRQPASSRGQLYCWINEAYWGRGTFLRAFCQASNLFFIYNSAPCITAHIEMNNYRSWNALRKLGFAHHAIVSGPYGTEYQMVLYRQFLPNVQ